MRLESKITVPTSAYIHIPFCRRRCFYCDFPVSVVGDQRHGGNSLAIARYVEALCNEIRLIRPPKHHPDGPTPLKTVFFGGGTPSLLTGEQLGQILGVLRSHLGIADDAEISIEMDPGTFDRAKLQAYHAAGISRISLGSQAFQDRLLEACGRTHRVRDIEAAVALLRQAGVENFSLDLISGLPTQTMADWRESLERAIALSPAHISAYDMVLEPGTVFGKRYQPGDHQTFSPAPPLPADDATADMYRLAQTSLTAAGYGHYEVSNYAQPGFQCRHNRVYWEMQPYYAFGMGAASFVAGARFTRPRTTRSYYDWLALAGGATGPGPEQGLEEQGLEEQGLEEQGLEQQGLEQQGLEEQGLEEQGLEGQGLEQRFGEILTPTDELLETLMLGMRLTEGVDLLKLQQKLDAGVAVGSAKLRNIAPVVQPFITQGWLHPLAPGRLQFTDPEGFLFSNQVLSTLFEVFEEVFENEE